MNVSLTDLNEIIHPQAEDIPLSISKDDVKMEGHTQDYIGSYMSYVQMLGTTCRLVIKCNSLCPIHKTLFYTTYISTH